MPRKKQTVENNIQEYNSSNLLVFKDLDHVRKRPGMYIGDTSITGYHHLIYEICDNSIDEISNGYGDFVSVCINKDESVTIIDNGRGIPVDEHPTEKISGARVVFEKIGAGGKFDKKSYKTSGGLHGVGASVVNALSEFVDVEIKRDGKIYSLIYKNQKVYKDLTIIDKCDKKDTGTKITFKPDKTIFKEDLLFNNEIILERLKEISYLNKNMKVIFKDSRSGFEKTFFNTEGILTYLKELANENEIIKPIYVSDTKDDVFVEFAFQYMQSEINNNISFVNNIKTIEGGTHETGLKTGITKAITDIMKEFGRTKKQRELNITSNDIFTGLNLFLNLKVPEPEFVGQTKTKLGNTNIRTIVNNIAYDNIYKFLSQNKNKIIRNSIINRIENINNINTMLKIKKETDNKKKELKKSKRNADKIAGCNSKNSLECELYIVEGDSAGGCFTKDTLIYLTDGRTLTIEDIVEEFKKGKINYVYSKSKNGKNTIQPIVNVFIKRKQEIIRVYLNTGEILKCTSNHKFMLINGKYKEIQYIKNEEILMSFDNNNEYRVIKTEKQVELEDVYDITVPPYNNFALASGIFVHNSAKQGRNRLYQAILSLKGKPLNVEKTTLKQVLNNDELSLLIQEIGTDILKDFDIKKLRYHKIIIMADADVDGSHIQLILLTFFYRYMPELIKEKKIFLAKPPLYKVYKNINKSQKILYAYNDIELEKHKKTLGKGCLVQRYKGLGEMNAEQLWETTMNPETRQLQGVTEEDAEKCNEIIKILMGKNNDDKKDYIDDLD